MFTGRQYIYKYPFLRSLERPLYSKQLSVLFLFSRQRQDINLQLFIPFVLSSLRQNQLEKGLIPSVKFLNLTVNHDLLQKLEVYGVGGHPLCFIKVYFVDRKQGVHFNEEIEKCITKCTTGFHSRSFTVLNIYK